MIIVMKTGASRDDIERVVAKVERRGLKTHLSEGEDRTVIGVIGHDPFAISDAFTHDEAVEDVVRITKPYKLSGREWRQHDTVVTLPQVATSSAAAPSSRGRRRTRSRGSATPGWSCSPAPARPPVCRW